MHQCTRRGGLLCTYDIYVNASTKEEVTHRKSEGSSRPDVKFRKVSGGRPNPAASFFANFLSVSMERETAGRCGYVLFSTKTMAPRVAIRLRTSRGGWRGHESRALLLTPLQAKVRGKFRDAGDALLVFSTERTSSPAGLDSSPDLKNVIPPRAPRRGSRAARLTPW